MRKFEGFERGVNLGGWLSQCDHTENTYDTFITRDDFKKIASWGLDHIRIPVDYDLVETDDGKYKESGFKRISDAIAWARENHLNMVLDLHKTYGYSFDEGEAESGFFENEKYQERFYKLWEEFAKRFGEHKDILAFELLNEVTLPSYKDAWNRISNTCVERIRAVCPDINILIGGYLNNSVKAVRDLLPPHDGHIVYNFHCYEPLIFTHQGAYWINTMDESFRIPVGATYRELKAASEAQLASDYIADFAGFDDETACDERFFEELFKDAILTAEERNVPLYCGEYGVVDLANPKETVEWYRYINKVFTNHGIGRAAWTYHGKDFGLADAHMKDVIDDIIPLL